MIPLFWWMWATPSRTLRSVSLDFPSVLFVIFYSKMSHLFCSLFMPVYMYTHTQTHIWSIDHQNGSPCYFSGKSHDQPCTFFETLEPGDGEKKGTDASAKGREAAWICQAKPARLIVWGIWSSRRRDNQRSRNKDETNLFGPDILSLRSLSWPHPYGFGPMIPWFCPTFQRGRICPDTSISILHHLCISMFEAPNLGCTPASHAFVFGSLLYNSISQ